jgi:hypothetical protein
MKVMVEGFDAEPFRELARLISVTLDRHKRRLVETPATKCAKVIVDLGDTLEAFDSINNDVRGMLSWVLRQAKQKDYKFNSTAQLYAELREVLNAIRRIGRGNGRDNDFSLVIAFRGALDNYERQEVARRVAA